MELHEGQLVVSSAGDGQGSTFSMKMLCYIKGRIPEFVSQLICSDTFTNNPLRPSSPNPLDMSLTRSGRRIMPFTYTNNHNMTANERNWNNNTSGDSNDLGDNNRVISANNVDISSQMPNIQSAPVISFQHSEVGIANNRLQVLVVDDVELTRKMTVRAIRHLGGGCDEAIDGQDAVNKVGESIENRRMYDLVLIDYQMPILDGPEAVSQMRVKGFTGKIVGITGYADEFHRNNFISHGADKVLLKPVSVADLGSLLHIQFVRRITSNNSYEMPSV